MFSSLFFIYVTHNFTPAWSNSCRRFTTSSYTSFIFFPFCFYMLVTFLNFVHISSFYVQCFVWDWLPSAYIWRSPRTFAFPLSILLYFHAFLYYFNCKSHQQLYSLAKQMSLVSKIRGHLFNPSKLSQCIYKFWINYSSNKWIIS